jgi:ComF family protein
MLSTLRRHVVRGLAVWRLPSLCAVCRGWGEARICPACAERFGTPTPRCERCALEWVGPLPGPADDAVCAACCIDPPPCERALAAVAYGPPWDALIARYKFHAALDLAPSFAALMLASHRRSPSHRPSLMLPVPLSRQRLAERGFNQAWELARRLARAVNCKADAHLLLRIRDTPHQLSFPRDERAANVKGAFAVEPRRRAEVGGQHVTLVDDVMTTGDTAAEIARVLLQAGAASVSVWVLARTPRPGD